MNKEEILRWRDALLTRERRWADGWVYSESLNAFVYMTSHQIIACIDALFSDKPTPSRPRELDERRNKIRDMNLRNLLNQVGIIYIKERGEA